MLIEFFAPGIPRPKGSKRLVRANGGRVVALEASKHEKPWRQLVTAMGHEAMKGAPPIEGALELELVFFFPRPKSHFTKKGLRPDAPTYHTSAPDTSKLIRSVEDGMNEVVIVDDRMLARVTGVKFYTEGTPGVQVKVRSLEHQPGSGLAALMGGGPCPSG